MQKGRCDMWAVVMISASSSSDSEDQIKATFKEELVTSSEDELEVQSACITFFEQLERLLIDNLTGIPRQQKTSKRSPESS